MRPKKRNKPINIHPICKLSKSECDVLIMCLGVAETESLIDEETENRLKEKLELIKKEIK